MKAIMADSISWADTGVWGINNQLKILFRYNDLTGEINYLCHLPKYIYAMTRQISVYRNKVFLYPYWNKELFVFNMDNGEWHTIEIDNSKNQYPYVYYIGMVNHIVYMFISSNGIIVELDADTFVYKKYYIPAKYVSKISSNDIKFINKYFVFPIFDKNSFLLFDINSKSIEEFTIRGFENGIVTVAYDESYYWITGKSKSLAIWDKNSNRIVQKWDLPYELKLFVEEQDKWIRYIDIEARGAFPFLKSTIVENKLWLFPYQTNMILQIDIRTGKHQEIFFYDIARGKKPCEYLGFDERKKQLVIRDYNNSMYSINPITAEKKKILIMLNDEQVDKVLNKSIVIENNEIGIIELIRKRKEEQIAERRVNTLGDKIYKKMKD